MSSNIIYTNFKEKKSTNRSKSTKKANEGVEISWIFVITKLVKKEYDFDIKTGYVLNEMAFRLFCNDFEIENIQYNEPDILRLLAENFKNRSTAECKYAYSFLPIDTELLKIHQIVEYAIDCEVNDLIDELQNHMKE